MVVYYAPKTEHTAYVFLDQLMKMKISDASWANDEEPPPNFLDYSDDEEEQRAKREQKIERMKKAGASDQEIAAKRARFEKEGKKKNVEEGDRLPGAVTGGYKGMNGRNWSNSSTDNSNQNISNPNNSNVHNSNSYNSNSRNSYLNNSSTNNSNTNNSNHHRANNLYGAHNNPFYRRSRTYDPKENGPIRWNSARPSQVSNIPKFSTPPPGYTTPTPPPSYTTQTPLPGYTTPTPPPGYTTQTPPPSYITPTPPPSYITPPPPIMGQHSYPNTQNYHPIEAPIGSPSQPRNYLPPIQPQQWQQPHQQWQQNPWQQQEGQQQQQQHQLFRNAVRGWPRNIADSPPPPPGT